MPTISVPLNKIIDHHDNVRTEYDQAELEELADSIAANGLLSPLLVHGGQDGSYQLIAGHRRVRAMKILVDRKVYKQSEPVDVVVHSEATSDADATVLMLVENVQRTDITAIDEARGYARLFEQFGVTKKDIATRTGKPQPHISKRMALLTLPEDLQAHVGRLLPVEAAYELTQCDEKDIKKIAKSFAEKGESYARNAFEWDLRGAVTRMKQDKAAEKFARVLAKHMIEVDKIGEPWDDWTERGNWEPIGTYDIDSIEDYTPRKTHMVCQRNSKATHINVYRKRTKKQIEAAEAEKQAYLEEAKRPPTAEELAEMDPYERWAYEVEAARESFHEADEAYQAAIKEKLAGYLKEMAPREISKVALALVAQYGANSRSSKATDMLRISPPAEDEDGNELSSWQRDHEGAIREYVGDSTARAITVWVASNVDVEDIENLDVFTSVRNDLAAEGVVRPDDPEEVPPPYQDADGNWHDGPEPDDFDDVEVSDTAEEPAA